MTHTLHLDLLPGQLNNTRTSTAAASTNPSVAPPTAQSLTSRAHAVPGARGAFRGTPLAHPWITLRVLEARFHPQQKTGGDFIVVGHVVWEVERGRPVVQPSRTLLSRSEPATLLSKLQYLVSINGPEAFERLQVLRSQFWSFVEVPLVSGGSA